MCPEPIVCGGVLVVREADKSYLLGTYVGAIDNTIHSRLPDTIIDPGDAALNLGTFYPEPRAVLFRFALTDPILLPVADRIISAQLEVHTLKTSATADQDVLVSFSALSPANAVWTESQVTWRHQVASTLTPWASGTNGPLMADIDHATPVVERWVRSSEMNSTGTPVQFRIDPQRVSDWITTPAANAGLAYWSFTADNGGVGLDDNFQVYSSESPVSAQRPALVIRYRSPFTRAVFDTQDMLINGGAGFTGYENTSGALTWGEAYIMRAYLQMYRSTGDAYYLNKFIAHADVVLAKRDDVNPNTPYNDPAWSLGARGYESAAVASGHILEGLVRFARIVNSDPALAIYSAKAAHYVARAQETINWLNAHFLFSLPGNRSAYRVYPDSTIRLDAPNADATMGAVLLDMYHATGDTSHLTLAERIGRTLVTNSFFLTERGNQAWSYAYGGAGDPEDFSHSGHVAHFIARMAREGHIFTSAQAASIAATVLQEGHQGGGLVTAGIEGSHSPESRIGSDPFVWAWGMAGGLIEIGQFDLRLLPMAEAVQLRHYDLGAWQVGWPLYSIANLVRFGQVPQEIELSMSVAVGGSVYRTTQDVVATFAGPVVVPLVNDLDAGDVRKITFDLRGDGDDWARQWRLSLILDASGAPGLVGGQLTAWVDLLDGMGNVKAITGVSAPAGFAATIGPRGRGLTATGTLAASQTLFVEAGEVTLIEGEPAYARADFDRSGEVDGIDLAQFQACLSGAGSSPVPAECLVADLDFDDDVDQSDYGVFQRCLSGSFQPAEPHCAD